MPLLRTRRRLSAMLYAAAVMFLAAAVALFAIQPAAASTPGTDWGPNGLMNPSDSAVTVRWDNTGATPAASRVPRDATQVIPHTGGKTYADIPASESSAIAAHFGQSSMTVSQTRDLQHQAVQITIAGVSGMNAGQNMGYDIFQCSGSATATQPDPVHCQSVQANLSATDQALAAAGDLKADTTVWLDGQQTGSDVTLHGVVKTSVTAGALYAGGATGSIAFSTSSGTKLGTVPVVDGQAVLSVHGASTTHDEVYLTQYLASPGENYLTSLLDHSSGALNSVVLPSTPKPRDPLPPSSGTNTSPNATRNVPFQAVDGTWAAATTQYWSSTTTNEILSATNGAQRFQIQTGAEAPGLGCGHRADQASTSTCWLVVLPNDGTVRADNRPGLGLWAQRMQVKLQFRDVAPSCGSGSRSISIGSELLLDAMNSWIPAICTGAKVDLGYIQRDDASARQSYSAGDTSLIFTSGATDDAGAGTSTLSAPAALAAVTIGVLSYSVSQGVVKPAPGVRLNARLVAKLLTQSYRDTIDYANPVDGPRSSVAADLPWSRTLPAALGADSEFVALNPTFGNSANPISNQLLLTLTGTDASAALWNWVAHDPDAKAFLDGCPDPASGNSVINPFYSTRSYAECLDAKPTLEPKAAAARSPQSPSNSLGTKLPATYTEAVPVYPPAGGLAPQPGYYARHGVVDSHGSVVVPEGTMANIHPRENTLDANATDVLLGLEKSLVTWCTSDLSCPGQRVTPPGIWTNGSPASAGSGVLGLTDGTAAAKNLLPTAQLCDTAGTHCVGANNDSLQKAADRFTPSAADPHALLPGVPDYAAGAYPLTLPVYAQINTKGLDTTTAAQYAKVLSYISTTGQAQGYQIGNLPPGLAPLTPTLLAQDATAIATLQRLSTPAPSPTPTPTATPTPSAAADTPVSGTNNNPGGTTVPQNQLPPVNIVPISSPTPQTTATSTPALTGITPAANVGAYLWAPGLSLVGALAAGIAAPIVGRRRTVAG